jgi:FkbM family methyltransferase
VDYYAGCRDNGRLERETHVSRRRRLFIAVAVAIAVLTAGARVPAKDILGTEQKLYSQRNEELIIRDFFQDRRDGFYLDVGCAWPQRNSTTYYLEKHLGWSGFGVDAVAEYGPMWAEVRERGKFFNFLVSDHADTNDTFYRADWTGVSSVDEENVKRWKVGYKKIEVPTITLNKLLDDNGVKKVDFLSLDIEGAQLSALRGFDIERFRPDLACVEMHMPDHDKILQYFDTHGYEPLDKYREHDIVNMYFKPKPDPKSAPEAESKPEAMPPSEAQPEPKP